LLGCKNCKEEEGEEEEEEMGERWNKRRPVRRDRCSL